MDNAHNRTEALLAGLLRRIDTRYANTRKSLTKQLTPLLDEMVLDGEATATQRVKHAKRSGLDKVVELATSAILDTTQSAWEDMGGVFEEVYAVNWSYERDFFLKRTGIDIEGEG